MGNYGRLFKHVSYLLIIRKLIVRFLTKILWMRIKKGGCRLPKFTIYYKESVPVFSLYHNICIVKYYALKYYGAVRQGSYNNGPLPNSEQIVKFWKYLYSHTCKSVSKAAHTKQIYGEIKCSRCQICIVWRMWLAFYGFIVIVIKRW